MTAALKRINQFAAARGLQPGEPLWPPSTTEAREGHIPWTLQKRRGIMYEQDRATVQRILSELGASLVQNDSTFADVGGMDELKAAVDKSFGVQVRNPEQAAALNVESAALLLTGEPGNGKSHFAKCAAGEYGYNNFITIDSGVLSTEGLQGKSEQKIRSVFELAKAISAMDGKICILFDEADSSIPSRDDATGSAKTRGNVNTFLTGLTSVNEDPNILIILCSNYLDQLDPAAIRSGRVKLQYEVGYPDIAARAAIFNTKLKALPADVVTVSEPVDVDHLAGLTAGMTDPMSLRSSTLRRSSAILRYEDDGGDEGGAILNITQADLEHAIQSRRGALRVTLDGDYSWEDLILPAHIVDELKTVVEQLTHAKEWEEKEHLRPLRGGILYGPPGTGKTQIARTLASNCSTPEAPCSFILADASAINSKWIGDGAKNLTAKFKEAAKNAPCILVFDEVQALIPDQSSGTAINSETDSIRTAFLQQLDGVKSAKGVFTLGITNNLEKCDPASIREGRLGDLKLEIPLPDLDSRRRLIDLFNRQRDVDPNLNVGAIAAMTDGLSGAAINALCESAGRIKYRQHASVITNEHFDQALTQIRRSMAA